MAWLKLTGAFLRISAWKNIGIVGGAALLVLFFPFARDVAINELHLASLERKTGKYVHPYDSHFAQKISLVGNFASASNQCGFIVAEVRISASVPDDTRAFYAPVLSTSAIGRNSSYGDVSLVMFADKNVIEELRKHYPELYGVLGAVKNNPHAYIIITADIGPPNYDPRCH